MTTFDRSEAHAFLRMAPSTFNKFLATYRALCPDYTPQVTYRGGHLFSSDVLAVIAGAARRCAAQPALSRMRAMAAELAGTEDGPRLSVPPGLAALQQDLAALRETLTEHQQIHADLRALLLDLQQSQTEILRRLQTRGV